MNHLGGAAVLAILIATAPACGDKKSGPSSSTGSGSQPGTAAGSTAAGSAAGSTAAGSAGSGAAAAVATVDAAAGAGSAATATVPPTRALYQETPLTDADLAGRTLRELALMRNWIFARAGHTFRKPWLRDFFTAQPWYAPLAKDDDSKITAIDRQNAKLIASHEAGFSTEALVASRDALAAKPQRTPEEEIELAMVVARAGTPVADKGGEGGEGGEGHEGSDYGAESTWSHLSDRLLTVTELESYSLRDLRLMRNEIYARHGRPFKSPLLREYFENTSWYEENASYDDKLLSKLETTNVRLIRTVEDSFGGPLTDDQDQNWFMGS